MIQKKGLIWGIFMTMIYFGMALLLIFSEVFEIKQSLRIIIGILFLIYGMFRGYRVWKMNNER